MGWVTMLTGSLASLRTLITCTTMSNGVSVGAQVDGVGMLAVLLVDHGRPAG